MLQSATSEIGTSFAAQALSIDAPIYAAGLRNPEAYVAYQPGVVTVQVLREASHGGPRRSKEILVDGAGAHQSGKRWRRLQWLANH